MQKTAIILNGSSSAGKTWIAQELMKLLGPEAIYTGLDEILERNRPAGTGLMHQLLRHFKFSNRLKILYQLNAEIAEHLKQRRNVIADVAIMEPLALKDLAEKLQRQNAYFIGVKPPLAVSEEWEKARGDRPAGQARKHYHIIHQHNVYDLTIDTSIISPQSAADLILTYIRENRPAAFYTLQYPG